MRVTLLESDRSFFRTAECAAISIVAHAAIVWSAVSATSGGVQLPQGEREARVFFLLPPDRVDVRSRQAEVVQWARLGTDIENGRKQVMAGEGFQITRLGAGRRGANAEKTGAQGRLPLGLVPVLPDTIFSVLDVDSAVERYEWSTAPAYPSALLATGTEGVVYAQFVVDTSGMVDTTSIRMLSSPHPEFTQSVRSALAAMVFRPAKRGVHKVRQLVEQHFRFTIVPQVAESSS